MKKIISILLILSLLPINTAWGLAPSLRTQKPLFLTDAKFLAFVHAVGKHFFVHHRDNRTMGPMTRDKFRNERTLLADIDWQASGREGDIATIRYRRAGKSYDIRLSPEELLKDRAERWKIIGGFGIQIAEKNELRMAASGTTPYPTVSTRDTILTALIHDDWKYIQGEIRRLLRVAETDGDRGWLFNFLHDCDEAQKRQVEYPIEVRYPILKAVTLLSKNDKDALIKILKEENNKPKSLSTRYHSAAIDSILLMLDNEIPEGWLKNWGDN